MLSVYEIIDFFKLTNSHAKKELGQNFLINKDVILKIVDALDIKEEDRVLEIGAGLGALSEEIINKATDYTIVEYDVKFVEYLNRIFEERSNVTIIKNNFLKYREYSANKIIGNLPYYITTDILEHIIVDFDNIQRGVFMVQKECLERVRALTGKDYNAINVVLSYFFKLDIITYVKKDCFFPEPSVDSVVFRIEKQENKELSTRFLYKIARICFLNRRKTLSNNLNSVIKDKEKTATIIKECGLKETVRAEELKVDDFVKLGKLLLKAEIFNL